MILLPYQQRLLTFWSRAKPGDKLMLTRGRLHWWPSEMDTLPEPVQKTPLRGLHADVVYIDEVDSFPA